MAPSSPRVAENPAEAQAGHDAAAEKASARVMYVPDEKIDWSVPETELFATGRLGFSYSNSKMETEFIRFHDRHLVGLATCALVIFAAFAIAGVIMIENTVGDTLYVILSIVNLAAFLLDVVLRFVLRPATTSDLARKAVIHEFIFSCTQILSCIILGCVAYSIEQACQRSNVAIQSTTAAQRREICERNIYPYGHTFLSVSLLCGRPRAFIITLCAVVFVGGKYFTRVFIGEDSMKDMHSKMVIDAVVASILVACHIAFERSYRASFEEYVKAHRSKQQAIKQKEATDAYLSQLLPPMLYSRLLSPEHYEDSGTAVTVFIASVTDLAAWVPAGASRAAVSDAVRRVSELMGRFEETHKLVGVERIRVTGDELIATSNLIVPTLSHALRIAVYAARMHPHVVRSGTPVRCAIHTGAVRGYVAGTRFLRYDVRGEGVDIARLLLSYCVEGEVVVSSATQALLRERAKLVPCDTEALPLTSNGDFLQAFFLRGLVSARIKAVSDEGSNSRSVTPESQQLDDAQRGSSSSSSVTNANASFARRVHFGSEGDLGMLEAEAMVAQRPPPEERSAKDKKSEGREVSKIPQEAKRESSSSGDEQQAPQDEVMKRVVQESDRLTIVSKVFLRFSDPQREEEYKPSPSFAFMVTSTGALFAFSSVLCIQVTLEFAGFEHSRLTGQGLIIAATAVSLIALISLVLLPDSTALWRRVLFLLESTTVVIFVIVGAAMTRPSIIGNDTCYMFPPLAASLQFVVYGWPWLVGWAFTSIVLTAVLFIEMFAHGGLVKISGLAFVVVQEVIIFLVLRWREMSARQRHRDALLIQTCNGAELEEKDLLQGALTAVLPAPLIPRVLNGMMLSGSRPGVVEYVNRGVVVVLSFPHPVSPVEARRDERYSFGLDAMPPNSASSSSQTSAPNELSESTSTEVAERALRLLRFLTLTKVIGDTVLTAGPLLEKDFSDTLIEAPMLTQAVHGRCTAVVTLGSFYAIVTGGRQQASFFLLGDAIHAAKMLLPDARPLGTTYTPEYCRAVVKEHPNMCLS